MDYTEIIKLLVQGQYAPVYFLQGDEPFFIDNVIQHIELNALDDAQKSFNQLVLYGKETDIPQVLTSARKYPMMGERQVVIVKEAQEMRGWTKEVNQSLLLQYLENPLASTILVFGYKYKTIDKRTKLGKSLDKLSVLLTSKKIYDNQVPGWIQSYGHAKGIELTHKAVMLLAENIGNNLQRLANEMDKLILNKPGDGPIDDKAVHRYVGISKDYNIFELQTALSTANRLKAQKIVQYFGANPSNHPLVLTIFNLFSYFSKLLLVHQSPSKDKQTIAKTIGVHPFFAEEYVKASSYYSLPIVLRNLHYLEEADLASKGITQLVPTERDLLKELVHKLMSGIRD